MFTINHDEAMDFGVIEEGEYEVVVAKAFENASKSGTECMDIQLIVRNDIEQPGKDKWIFHKVWKAKATGQFNSGMINTMAKALRLPNGKKYASVKELLDVLLLKTAKVTIKHRDWEGKTQVDVANWEVTKFPQCNHQWKDGQAPANGPKEDYSGIEGFDSVEYDNIPF